MTAPHELTLDNLTDLGNGYFTRDLSAGRVELFRADGFSFGDTGREYIDQVIRHDQDYPAPATGTTLEARFADPAQPSTSVVEPPADQPRVVELPVVLDPADPQPEAVAPAADVLEAIEKPKRSRGSKA